MRIRTGHLWAALLAGLLAAGLAPGQEGPAEKPDPRDEAQAYRLGPGDEVRVQVWNENIDQQATVRPGGDIVLAEIGRVKVDGLTVEQAEKLLQERYADGYYKDPKVILTIEKHLSHWVLAAGAIRNSRKVPLIGRLTLSELYVEVGDFLPDFTGRIVVVRKHGKDAGKTWHITRQSLLGGDPVADIILADRDRVYFQAATRQTVNVAGAVKHPGAHPLSPGMTLLDAISAAGGLLPEASNRVRLFRRAVKQETGPEAPAGQDDLNVRRLDLQKIRAGEVKAPRLVHGDNIIVEPGEGSHDGIWIVGAVNKPGWYPWPTGRTLTVRKALTLAGDATAMASLWRIKIDRASEKGAKPRRIKVDLDTPVEAGDTIIVPESWI